LTGDVKLYAIGHHEIMERTKRWKISQDFYH